VTYVGRRLNIALVAALLVLAAGTVGATALFQSGVSEVEAQNEQLRSQNEQLREELRSARDRIESLETRVSSLESELAAANETLAEVRSERDGYREDLSSVCEQLREENDSVPEECADG
jgi:septal ring factor EnvC (AmiA/AmiB activator)